MTMLSLITAIPLLLTACGDPTAAPDAPGDAQGAATVNAPAPPPGPGANPGQSGPPPSEAPARATGEDTVQVGVGVWTSEVPADVGGWREDAVCPGCDVVVITMCSVRRDHLGAYGGEVATPNLDKLADGAFRFDKAYSASNFTLSSLTAILTARFGSSTGVLGWDKGLTSNVPTLPEVLGLYGYHTGGFTVDAASGFRPDYGLNRGFQHLEIIAPPSDTPDGRQPGGPTGSGLSAAPAVAWLGAQEADAPFFAMLHTRTAHFPFVVAPPTEGGDPTGITSMLWEDGLVLDDGQIRPGLAGGTAQQGVPVEHSPNDLFDAVRAAGEPGLTVWREHYAASVARMDADIGAVWGELERSGRLDKTILVVVADHGESLNEHQELLHGDAYFDGVTRVPLLVRVPGLKGRSIEAMVSHVDIAPTLMELVGAKAPADIDGVSAVPVLKGEAEVVRATAFVEGGVTLQDPDNPRGAVIAPPWVLLHQDMICGPMGQGAPQPPFDCLFSIDDPDQTKDLSGENPEVVSTLLARWTGFRGASRGQTVARELTLDPEFVTLLKRSGYDFAPLEE